jgi:SAM-dependent methyltransferase
MPASPLEEDRNIFLSTEEEAARLLHWNGVLHRVLGGLSDLSGYERILDLACGPGGWALGVGGADTGKQVMGIDSDPRMLRIAQEQALVAGKDNSPLPNVTFRLMPLTPPLPLQDSAFDFIHARGLAAFLSRESWAGVLGDCLRLLRPGGRLSCTEAELPVTSSPAFERLSALIAEAYRRARKNLSGGTRTIGVSAALPRLLRLAGFQGVEVHPVFLDFSADASLHAGVLQNVVVALRLIQPFLLDWGVTTTEEIEPLYQQALVELRAETFAGSLVLLSIKGEKADL